MDKIDRLIQVIRNLKEEMSTGSGMTTGSSDSIAGFSGAADPEGPTAGYDPVMSFGRRRRPTIIGKGKYPGARKRWSKR